MTTNKTNKTDKSSPHPIPTLLMCRPTLYQVAYVINPWMEGNLGNSSQPRAMQQWEHLHATLSRLARVLLVDPVPGSPDMVFTANAGLARDGIVAISSFHHPERQAEEEHFRRWFVDAGYRIIDLPRDTSFEGEGDALFSTDGSTLWVGHGARTHRQSHTLLESLWPAKVESLHLTDPRFYHLDTCFSPLEDGSLLYYPPAFDAPSLARIHAVYAPEQRIAVTEEDALRFACNAVNLGRTIVLNHISPDLERTLRDRGFDVIQLALDEFLKAGGAAKCLVMKLTSEIHTAQSTSDPATRAA
ncbi:dimethylarginine dimethylaminohydrolase family protein [Granulicella sibirica]|uniref:arginine deiminase n=1 Tax=Granulicella sibirica TaxID=2479048 RepID=A0A4Q0T5I1_9BACT|nr:arginine deiminase-related protein [Granulicella sibirica]RXH56831.1 hypothetical protein GRAN_0141 [Granulicella sibirica]